ncbi:MAG: hypothetical protein II956_05380 [Bacteroidales bacterium]|nr:hypothetical protein [Bacteroidales bacterium]
MKKIISLCAMLVMVLTVTFSLNSCSSITVGSAIGELSAQCPMDMGDGMTMTAAEIVNGDAVISVNAPSLSAEALNANMSAVKANLINMFKSDAEVANVFKDSDTKIIYRYKCGDGDVEIVISPSEL